MVALPVPDPPLEAGAVLLRAWRPTDLPALLAAFAEPSVQRWSWAGPTPYAEADARDYLVEQENGRLRGEAQQWAIVAGPAHLPLLGGVSVYDVDRSAGVAAVGYWLVPQARGRGVATTAVGLVAGWAYGVLGLRRLRLTCAPDNTASQRVAERAGFGRQRVLPGHLSFRGRLRDSVLYELAAPEG